MHTERASQCSCGARVVGRCRVGQSAPEESDGHKRIGWASRDRRKCPDTSVKGQWHRVVQSVIMWGQGCVGCWQGQSAFRRVSQQSGGESTSVSALTFLSCLIFKFSSSVLSALGRSNMLKI